MFEYCPDRELTEPDPVKEIPEPDPDEKHDRDKLEELFNQNTQTNEQTK